MQTKISLKLLSASLAGVLLSACGGGGGAGSALDNALNSKTSSSSSSSSSTPTTITSSSSSSSSSVDTNLLNWQIGTGSGSAFVAGTLDLAISDGSTNLYADGSAILSVSLVSKTGDLISDPVAVTFTSACLSANNAQITGGNTLNSTSGTVNAEYKPVKCVGSDLVTATATYKNRTLSASKVVTIRNKRLGVNSGANFIPTKLNTTSNSAALFTNQTATLSVNVVNDLGNLVEAPTKVTFSSPCLDAGTASITGGKTITSIGGVVNAEYKVGSCFGDDTVQASITYAGIIAAATTTIPKINNKNIGANSGANFTPGQLTVSTSTDTLFEGDITQLSVNIVDNQNNLISQATQVIFESDCINNGLSSIAGGGIVNSTSGVAKAQYKVGKCNVDDVITASIANGDQPITASVTLPIDTRRMGSGFGADFINNGLELGIGSGALSPGGSTTLTAYLVNSKGELATDAIKVTFSSPCLSSDNASITGGNTVTAVNGKAIAVYTSKGCSGVGGVDAIKASAPFRSTVLSAAADLTVKSDTAQTISFVSANPELVSIKGTGGLETSVLTFKVLGQGGSPLKGVCVNFAPSTTVGGVALVPSKCNPTQGETYGATTDANGLATTTVQAGTVATAMRVTATTENGISTQSSALAVTTGIPDQNSMSLSLSNTEPVGWQYDGIESKATIRLADAFNNLVPNGTAVTFTTSGGAIEGSCVTGATAPGACTVTWRSQAPRPTTPEADKVVISDSYPFTKTCPGVISQKGGVIGAAGVADCRSGRVKILATAIGNESFIDGNGNGLYDGPTIDTFSTSTGSKCHPAVPLSTAGYGATDGCDDLREAYIDKDFDGERSIIEEFIDFNNNGIFDLLPNGKYDGALCTPAAKSAGDCTNNKVTVRDDATLVMACDYPFTQPNTNRMPGQPASKALPAGVLTSIPILLADCNGNGLPAGTTVALKTGNLTNVVATVSPSVGLSMSTEPSIIILSLTADKDITKLASGEVTLEVTAPVLNGSKTTAFSISVSN